MGLKRYQPGRKEFLINTDWGLPKESFNKDEAKARGLVIFKGRWVTKEERSRLQDEYHAYYSIRQIAWLLICTSSLILLLAILYIPAVKMGLYDVELLYIGFFIGLAGLPSGIGLLKYKRWARNLAAFVLLVPFPLGLVGVYYLFRKTARRIFNGASCQR